MDISDEPYPDGIVVLRVRDAIDASNSDQFADYLNTKIPEDVIHIVVDLGELTLLSTSGVRVLIEQTKLRSLLTVAPAPHIRKILDLTSSPGELAVYDSVVGAIAACRTTPEIAELRQEIYGLRAALRTRPMIARALGLLQGRYQMSDVDKAFVLLRESAQRHNLKLHTLAGALLAAPPPRSVEEWFPGRVRRPAPPLSFQPFDKQHNRTAVLATFLEKTIDLMDTTTGDLQLLDGPNALRLEQHRGLPPEFIDFFAVVSDSSTPCALALQLKSRVVVPDVATDPTLVGTSSGKMVLDVGIRSLQSTPLLTPDGRCVGMVSTHDSRTGRTPTEKQTLQLDRDAKELAIWLDWHQRTIVLDALEYIHQHAK
ncbi:anti-anti-sigma factor [Kibdelosporangium banguiense]|uniref:Anti-anti-sigma factor n=1 Tax=Kibdelosporangium banguiense TaxID=1365924 RepID=A0ABS4TKY9_9PSEU|nr:ANTAR domain-containing protein [Kibdelosporangium banguiense]MBP2325097.1 anti-anti-sigma factor [Kibdelosporangium banguiense]